jgi:hypothetical protein
MSRLRQHTAYSDYTYMYTNTHLFYFTFSLISWRGLLGPNTSAGRSKVSWEYSLRLFSKRKKLPLSVLFDFEVKINILTVPDNKSRNIPKVVLVRRWAVGVLGIRRGGVSWVKGGVNGVSLQATWDRGGRFLSQLGGCQVSKRGCKGGTKGIRQGESKKPGGIAPCIYVTVPYV